MTVTEPALVHPVNWNLEYRLRVGKAWSRFMRGLAKRQLLASRCPQCARIYVPPKSYCETCFVPIEEWTELEPVGTLHAATIVYQGFEGGPKAPYAVGAILVDGADTMLMHFVSGVDLSVPDTARAALRVGTRVRAVWSDTSTESITDIASFAVES
jgi:uncharacterized protein